MTKSKHKSYHSTILERPGIRVSISEGNMKLGEMPSVSLPPILSCVNSAGCREGCYALKVFKQYPSVREAWERNMKSARGSLKGYFETISDYLVKEEPPYFRWHVSGDILDQEYLNQMIAIVKAHRLTNFLAYTKMYMLDFSKRPKNLSCILSSWPGIPFFNPQGLPSAWVLDSEDIDERIPADSFTCERSCAECKRCWFMKGGESVTFHKH